MNETPSSALKLALAVSMLYGTVMTWRYCETRRALGVYQNGALSMIAHRVLDVDSEGQERRMAELGLLDAPHDTPARRRADAREDRELTALLPPGQD